MRPYIILFFLLFSPILFGQHDKKDNYIQQEQLRTNYHQSPILKMPDSWSVYPPDYLEKETNNKEYTSEVPFTRSKNEVDPLYDIPEEQIVSARTKKYKAQPKESPTILQPEPIRWPSLKNLKLNTKKEVVPTIPKTNFNFERIRKLIIAIGILLLFFALYKIVKNIRLKSNSVSNRQEQEWNPNEITKTELEKNLEKAELSNNYRECIRVLYLFMLKALIEHKLIDWKPEKTNFQYVNEVKRQTNKLNIEEIVRIFELVWYGKYSITKEQYGKLKPTMESYQTILNVSL